MSTLLDALSSARLAKSADKKKKKEYSHSEAKETQTNPLLLCAQQDMDLSSIQNFNPFCSVNSYYKPAKYDEYINDIKPEMAVERAADELGEQGGYKYGEFGPWCAAFSSWVYGGKHSPWGDEHSVGNIKQWAVENGVYKQGKTPDGIKPGDLVVWRPETCNGRSHIGVVSKVGSDGSITTVEGNSNNQVRTLTYPAGQVFDGYVKVNEYKEKNKSISITA